MEKSVKPYHFIARVVDYLNRETEKIDPTKRNVHEVFANISEKGIKVGRGIHRETTESGYEFHSGPYGKSSLGVFYGMESMIQSGELKRKNGELRVTEEAREEFEKVRVFRGDNKDFEMTLDEVIRKIELNKIEILSLFPEAEIKRK